MAVADQSFGGWRAAAVMQADTRFRAALLMNPATPLQPHVDPTQVVRPVLVMTGELDARVPVAAYEDFFAHMPATSDRWLLVVPNAGHEFTNTCFPAAATIPCTLLLAQDRLIGVIRSVGTQFLNTHLAGSDVTSALIASA